MATKKSAATKKPATLDDLRIMLGGLRSAVESIDLDDSEQAAAIAGLRDEVERLDRRVHGLAEHVEAAGERVVVRIHMKRVNGRNTDPMRVSLGRVPVVGEDLGWTDSKDATKSRFFKATRVLHRLRDAKSTDDACADIWADEDPALASKYESE